MIGASFLLYLAMIFIIYVGTFKKEFTEEHVGRVIPIFAILIGIYVIILIAGIIGLKFGG